MTIDEINELKLLQKRNDIITIIDLYNRNDRILITGINFCQAKKYRIKIYIEDGVILKSETYDTKTSQMSIYKNEDYIPNIIFYKESDFEFCQLLINNNYYLNLI